MKKKEQKLGIYKITNKINQKFYIGSSERIRGRWVEHLYLLRSNQHTSTHLQNAWNLYKEENFTFEILEECSKDILIKREQYYLDTLLFAQEYIRREDSRFLELGYNINPTAGKNRKGTTQAKESIIKGLISCNRNREIVIVNNKNEKIDEFSYVFEAMKKYNIGSCSFYLSINNKQLTKRGIGFMDKKDFDNGIKLTQPKVGNKGVSIPYKGEKRAVDLYNIYGDYVKSFEDLHKVSKYLNAEPPNIHKKLNKINPKKLLTDSLSSKYLIVDKGKLIKELSNIKNEWSFIFDSIKKDDGKIEVYNCFDEFIGISTVNELSKLLNVSIGGITNSLYRGTFIKSLKLKKI